MIHLVKVFVAIFTASTVTLFLVMALAIATPICGLLPPPLYPPAFLLYLSRAIIHPILEAVMTKEIHCVLQTCLPKRCRGKQDRTSDDGRAPGHVVQDFQKLNRLLHSL